MSPSGIGSTFIDLLNPSRIIPGKNMTFFINIPKSTNWTYVAAFAQDGPVNNCRFTSSGYNQNQVIPGEWNSFVVPVPANFSSTGSRIGVALYTSAGDPINVYVDAISFDN